jgi:hypothetical protein
MKKIIVSLLIGAVALVGMATAAAGLQTVETGVVGRGLIGGGGGDTGRYWGCAGNDDANQSLCVEDPVPTSSVGVVKING